MHIKLFNHGADDRRCRNLSLKRATWMANMLLPKQANKIAFCVLSLSLCALSPRARLRQNYIWLAAAFSARAIWRPPRPVAFIILKLKPGVKSPPALSSGHRTECNAGFSRRRGGRVLMRPHSVTMGANWNHLRAESNLQWFFCHDDDRLSSRRRRRLRRFHLQLSGSVKKQITADHHHRE